MARIFTVRTEERYLAMPNDKKFSTGNHPVEMTLPMLHFLSARFEIDLITPTGAPIAIEICAMPGKDPHVAGFFHTFETVFKNPQSLAEFLNTAMTQDASLTAKFIPGG